jgi:hypothetical protein
MADRERPAITSPKSEPPLATPINRSFDRIRPKRPFARSTKQQLAVTNPRDSHHKRFEGHHGGVAGGGDLVVLDAQGIRES